MHKLKNGLIPLSFCLFLVFLITFSTQNLIASKNGLILWATCLVPSLLPFFIATELLNSTNIPIKLGRLFNKIMGPIFNSPGEVAYAFIMGIISGYPVGAKIIGKFYENKICTKQQAERILAFTNNSSPLFIIGTIGISLFCNSDIGILLFFTHILACITVGIIFGFMSRFIEKDLLSKRSSYSNTNTCNFSNLGDILANSINSAISTILMIGGFVILFSIIISIINNLKILDYICNFTNILGLNPYIVKCFFSGLIELTNGVNLCSIIPGNLNSKIILCSILLSFGGFSILLQVLSIATKFGLSIKWYIAGKILQSIFSGLYTYILLNSFIWRFFYG